MRPLVLAFTMLATASAAQDADQITLKYDDGSGVSGNLIDFKDNVFRLQASVGLIAIPAQDVSCIGAACPEGTALEVPLAPVTLTSLDGGQTLTGNVIDFVDDQYVLASEIGELRVDASLVTCDGIGCVERTPPVNQEVTLESGSTTIEGRLLSLEDGYYIVDVDELGELRVDATMFDCRGDACP